MGYGSELNSFGVNIGIGRKTATIVIAASNSKNPVIADYICNGINDKVTIQAANDALSAGGKIILLDGLYNFGSGHGQFSDNVDVEGCGIGTVLNTSESDYRAIRLGQYGSLKNVKITGTEEKGGIQANNHTVLKQIYIDGGTGIEASYVNVNIDGYTALNIHDASGQAACIHAGLGANGVRAKNLYFDTADRGIETEGGAENVYATGGIIKSIGLYYDKTYTFTLDVHNHVGEPACKNVIYENFYIENCWKPITCYAEGTVHENITYKNIKSTGSTKPSEFSCNKGLVENCDIDLGDYNANWGFWVRDYAVDVTLRKLTVRQAQPVNGIYVLGSNCRVLNCDVYLDDDLPASYGIEIGATANRNEVSGCYVYGTPAFEAINIRGKNAIVTNNICPTKTIWLRDTSSYCYVAGNIVLGGTITDNGANNAIGSNVAYV